MLLRELRNESPQELEENLAMEEHPKEFLISITFHGHVGYFIALLLKTWFSGQQHQYFDAAFGLHLSPVESESAAHLEQFMWIACTVMVEKHRFREPWKVSMLPEGMETTAKALSREAPFTTSGPQGPLVALSIWNPAGLPNTSLECLKISALNICLHHCDWV